jgi:phage/plasmid-like protein (TIGR03299 family)
MAHNIFEHDNMMAVGKAPWHGLGTTLETPPTTAAEALQVAGLEWSVSKLPMFLEDARAVRVSGSVSKRNDGFHGAIVRQDTDEILGVVGPSYMPFQNSQMAEIFEPLVADGSISIQTAGSLFNGRRVWMLGRFGADTVIANGDTVRKYMLLAHGHDGQFSVRFGFTPIRVVCWNTLSAAVGSEESKLVRCLHTSGLQQNLETLRDAMKSGEEIFELTAEQYRKLSQKGVNKTDLREYARIVIEADVESSRWTRPQAEKIAAIVENATSGKGNTGSNWWHAYNGVTEFVCHQATRSAERRLSEAWWGEGKAMSSRALAVAIEMAGIA